MSTSERRTPWWRWRLPTAGSGHTADVRSIAFSPDGRILATESEDRTVRLWDVGAREPIGEPLAGHGSWVRTVAFSPDGTTIASASDDRTVRMWRIVS